MQKKLTISIDEQVYEGLYEVIGARRISRFIEDLVRPYVLNQALESAYEQMAQDKEREVEALTWAETLFQDAPFNDRSSRFSVMPRANPF